MRREASAIRKEKKNGGEREEKGEQGPLDTNAAWQQWK